ncbi:MAG: LUD domain-containing protein [Candidatus Pacearchaeota archaeon]|nr:LUD domain-containing protein [Candidatus Pacearchaeota archaeon]
MKKINLQNDIKNNENTQKTIIPIIYSYKEKRDKLLNEEQKEKFCEELRKIKEKSINNIVKLKKETIKNLSNQGINVIEAQTVKDAINIIKKIIGKEKTIIKSKSNTITEINLENALKNKKIIETDLGDFIIQLFKEKGIHPVLPSFHLTPKEISKKIKEKFNININPNPKEIVCFVRNILREKIFNAKIGITGANVISSDGSIFILENEGNISLISRIPEKHIILTSFDKIVETREEALKIIRASSIFGTGQDYPVYVNIISGPSKTADIENEIISGAQGAKEVYLILLDNKRTTILNSKFKELLYCINCGACLNFCPVYHQIFSRYGAKYFPGAKGVISSFFKESEKDAFNNGAFFCTTCQQCKENCPMKINLSDLIRDLRKELVKQQIEPSSITEMIDNVKKFGNPFGKIDTNKKPDKLYCC